MTKKGGEIFWRKVSLLLIFKVKWYEHFSRKDNVLCFRTLYKLPLLYLDTAPSFVFICSYIYCICRRRIWCKFFSWTL